MAYGVIYKITCKLDGKPYVGKTKQGLKRRITEHKRDSNRDRPGIDAAIKKYGWENFTAEVIEECPIELLNEREIFWIATLGSKAPNGYNLTDGGDGGRGLSPSPETRAKISAKLKGKPAHNKGKKHTAETRAKMSAVHKGKNLSEAARAKLSIAKKGVPKSPEHRAKLAKANTGKRATDETRAKMSAKRKGVPKSPKHRTKLSIANRSETIFKNLQDEMDTRQLSYTALAKLMNLSQPAISDKMRGKYNFTAEQIAKLVEIFDKPAEYLMARD